MSAVVRSSIAKVIAFAGTKEEWNQTEKATDWNYGVPATKVVCSDGKAAL